MIERRGMRKGPEALHALKLSATFRGEWGLCYARERAIRGSGGGGSGVRFLRDNALALIVLDYVARLVPQALSGRERVDEWFCFNG